MATHISNTRRNKLIHCSEENIPCDELIKHIQLCSNKQERSPLVFVLSPQVFADIMVHRTRWGIESWPSIPMTHFHNERFQVDIIEARDRFLAQRVYGSNTHVSMLRMESSFTRELRTEVPQALRVRSICPVSTPLPEALVAQFVHRWSGHGDTLRTVSLNLPYLLSLITMGDWWRGSVDRVSEGQLQVSLPCPASQRSAHSTISDLTQVPCNHATLKIAQGVGVESMSAIWSAVPCLGGVGVSVCLFGQSLICNSVIHLGGCALTNALVRPIQRARKCRNPPVRLSDVCNITLAIDSLTQQPVAQLTLPDISQSDETKRAPKETSVMSGQPSRTPQLLKRAKRKQRQAVTCTVNAPEMLLMHALGRFVYSIYPLNDFSLRTEEEIEKRVVLTKQLLVLVQEALAKASKTKAQQWALKRLHEPNQDFGMLELQMGDLLCRQYELEFPSQHPLEPEAFLEDRKLCFEVSYMVTRVLLQPWAPRVKFFNDDEYKNTSPKQRRRWGSLTSIRAWATENDLSQLASSSSSSFTDENDEELLSLKADRNPRRKAVWRFFHRVLKAFTSCTTCGSQRH